jgi:CRP/FNR family transcriptional regulator, cyclic AMP receptor protein
MKVSGLFTNAQETVEVPAGATIFRQGDAGDVMYGVISGEVELRIGDRPVVTRKADDVFGELALIDGQPRTATAVAVSDCRLATINQRRFLFLVHETPMFAIQVMASLAERMRERDS